MGWLCGLRRAGVGFGLKAQGLGGFRASGFRGLGFRVLGFRFRAQGSGFKSSGFSLGSLFFRSENGKILVSVLHSVHEVSPSICIFVHLQASVADVRRT